FNPDRFTTELNAAADEVLKLTPDDITRAFEEDRKRIAGGLQKLSATAAAKAAADKTNLDRLNATIAGLGDQIRKAEQANQEARASFDKLLFWNVPIMIAAIVLVFAIIGFFPRDLALRVISERTMIELMSMGFLLLTIIILGTGNLIKGE